MTSALAITTVDLARWQFALTTLFHFIFVPLTLGLAPLLAVMQTRWHRTGDEKWRRLTRFFGTLFLINFAIGVATGLVMEFQFGMNWSAFSAYVGDVFGPPLAIEGIGAFMLEAVFIGLWIFGWDRLSPRVHLATIYLVWLGTWLSAYFILTANSWMQHPVGYEVDSQTGRARGDRHRRHPLPGVHVLRLDTRHPRGADHGAASSCSASRAGTYDRAGTSRPSAARRRSRSSSCCRPRSSSSGVGSEFGVSVTDAQPMKIAATEALWDTEQPAALLALPDRRVHRGRPDAVLRHRDPRACSRSSPRTRSRARWSASTSSRARPSSSSARATTSRTSASCTGACASWPTSGPCWLLLALWGAWLVRRKRLENATWFQRAALVGIALPFFANFAGWILSEAGRQPWVVYGLLKTEDAVSSSVSTWTVGLSLTVFVSLYAVLGLTDFILMRRYARMDPPEPGGEGSEEAAPQPAPAF